MYSYYSSQQQQQQPLQTLPSSPLTQPHLLAAAAAASSSPGSPAYGAHSHTGAVQFGFAPGSQPGVLGWGVGMSAANGAGFGFGAHSSSAYPSHAAAAAVAAQAASPSNASASTRAVGWGAAAAGNSRSASPSSAAAATPTNSSRRRRRSPSPEHGYESGDDEHMSVRKVRPMHSASSKRARVQTAVSTGADSLSGGSHQMVVGDLGKALASLDKPALLDVFSRLLTTQPALAPLISTLLPTPSLSTVLSTLAALERGITAATPTGAFVRPEYVWSRVRVAVEEFVTEARRFINLFVPTTPPPAGHTVTEADLSHPSTCFEFLEALTRALLRLEASLPAGSSVPTGLGTLPSLSSSSSNPLAAHLVPLTLNAWHTFLTRLSAAVQSDGKVLPNSLVQSWFDRLDALAAESVRDRVFGGGGGHGGPSSVRRAMEGVRDRAKRELGWLVGLKGVDGATLSAGMEGVEQEEEEL